MLKSFKQRHLKQCLARSYIKYMNLKLVILVDLGGTNCSATIRDFNGRKVLRGIVKSEYCVKVNPGKKGVLSALNDVLKNYVNILEYVDIRIALPGVIYDKKVSMPNLLIRDWELAKELMSLFKIDNLILINDAIASFKGEKTDGTVIRIGTGIGGAEKNLNIEFGRSIKIPSLKYTYLSKSKEVLENYASGKALKNVGESKGIFIKCEDNEYAQKLNELAVSGNVLAQKIISDAGGLVGKAIRSYHKHKGYNDSREYIISGSLGLNELYFKGIKENSKLNIKKSKYKGSEAIYLGLV